MYNGSLYMALTTIVEKCFKRFEVPKEFYSIGRAKEGAVCIERLYSKGVIVVYEGLEHENSVVYNSPVLAVSDFIDKVYAKQQKSQKVYEDEMAKYFIGEFDETKATIDYINSNHQEEENFN